MTGRPQQWRYERVEHHAILLREQWSNWMDSRGACEAMAANPDFGTGRMQVREKPAPNPITVEEYRG